MYSKWIFFGTLLVFSGIVFLYFSYDVSGIVWNVRGIFSVPSALYNHTGTKNTNKTRSYISTLKWPPSLLTSKTKLLTSKTKTSEPVKQWAEIKHCPSNGRTPLYGKWQRIPGSKVSKDPVDEIFHYGIFTETVFNSTENVKRPEKDSKYVVPNIQHYAWYSSKDKNAKRNFRFHHYLSMLSAWKQNKPECFYFWYEDPPTGPLWEQIKQTIRNLIMVYREAPTRIYGKSVKVPEHKSDVIRLEAVIRYGGLYTDLDVLIVKPFTELRVRDVTMGYESVGKIRNWLCNAIIFAKPNATFNRLWHAGYKTFNDNEWGRHSVYLPATLAKQHPELIHTEMDTMNRPNWEEREWLYNEGKLWDWSRNYAVHLYYRFHNQDHNPEDIKRINTTMGELFRYVYYGNKNIIK